MARRENIRPRYDFGETNASGCSEKCVSPFIGCSTHGSNCSTEQSQRAAEIWGAAWKWTLDHPSAWETISNWALDRASHGNVSIQIAEVVRGSMMDGIPTRFSNSYIAAWSRMLILRYPQLRGHILLKSSMFDALPWDRGQTITQLSIFDELSAEVE